MLANLHSHTVRCHHASGTQREYIEKAIEAGFRVWGFSDHTPYPFPEGFTSSFRMLPSELESYVEETIRLRDEYRDQIEIHLGLEAEYYPMHFEALIRLCEQFPIEYMILGQHAVKNEYDGVFSGRPTEDEQVLKTYCDQVCEGVETGRFLYVAHPDVINFTGDRAIYEKHMRKLCQRMVAMRIPGEINFLGLLENRNYPNSLFWKIAGEEGLETVFGVDAHHVQNIHLPQCEAKALQMAQEYHLNVQRFPGQIGASIL